MDGEAPQGADCTDCPELITFCGFMMSLGSFELARSTQRYFLSVEVPVDVPWPIAGPTKDQDTFCAASFSASRCAPGSTWP
jgi:hypothetical protein